MSLRFFWRSILTVLFGLGVTANAVTLTWNANPEPDIAGYRLYYGQESLAATATDVGNNTTHSLSGLAPGQEYYFYVTAYNTAGLESDPSASVHYTPPSTPISGGVKFLGADSETGGSWKGRYGRDGVIVTGDAALPPNYGSVTPAGHSQWTWQSSTVDPAALQRIQSDSRLASCWYSSTSFDVEFRTSGTSPKRVSLYFLDWDSLGRAEKIEVIDLQDGRILNTQVTSNFVDGVYLSWEVTKSVRFRVTRLAGVNAVLSGIFFDSGGVVSSPVFSQAGGYFTNSLTLSLSTSTTNATIRFTLDGSTPTPSSPLYSGPITLTNSSTVSARAYAPNLIESHIQKYTFMRADSSDRVRFLQANLNRSGTWKSLVGSVGHSIATERPMMPSFGTVELQNANQWVWAFPAEDTAALQRPYQTGRIASTWYQSANFTVKLRFSDTATHRVSLYFVDYDGLGRVQTVDVLDPISGAVLDRVELEQFSDGVWLEYEIKEGADIRVTRQTGPNAVMSGVFFD